MRLPFLSETGQAIQKQLGQFKGYNNNLVIGDNEFKDMRNMCSDYFPAIGTRKSRGAVLHTLSKPNGLFFKNGLVYVDGTKVYYKDSIVGTVTDSKKQIIGMGAYVLIWPDKCYYNTHTSEFGSLVKEYVQSGMVTFQPVSSGSNFTKILAPGIDFNRWDSVVIEGCTNAALNTTKVIQEVGNGYIVVIATIESQFTQANGLRITRKVPDMDFICESDNRIWGCSSKNHEIYASKLGDPFNWNNYEGISTDSYTVTVGSDGDFTGAISHLGNVLFFKENTIHKMYGNKPSNFQLNTYTLPGVAAGCSRSLCIVNETLYYKSRNGICTYDGSMPYSISAALGNESYSDAVGCQFDGKYYVSMKDSGNHNVLMVYDPKYQIWHKEDDTKILMATYGEGKMYYVDSDNCLRTIQGDGTEKLDWMIESGDMIENTLNQKYVSKLMFNMQLDRGAKAEIYLQYDSDPMWERKFTINSAFRKSYVVSAIPRRCGQFRYRIVGTGGCKLFGISKFVEEGSEM